MRADSEQPPGSAWRDVYLAALFEGELAKLPDRIAAAEYTLGLRNRELGYSRGRSQSREAGAGRCHARSRSLAKCTSVPSPGAPNPRPRR